MKKKLYLISQNTNNNYDTFDSAVVVATSKKEARQIHPAGTPTICYGWTDSANVKADYLGVAASKYKVGEVICASFNAG